MGKRRGFVGLSLVLWWIKAGQTPTLDEAKLKLKLLEENGPSALAFAFKQQFAAPLSL